MILENAVFLKAEQNRFVFICKWNSALSQSDYRSIFPKADVHQAIGKQVHALWGPPRALRHLQRPGAVPLGYSGTFFSALANKIASQMFKTSLIGVTLLREKKRKMKRSNFKFICRVIFPRGLECNIWGSAPSKMIMVNGFVSLLQKK